MLLFCLKFRLNKKSCFSEHPCLHHHLIHLHGGLLEVDRCKDIRGEQVGKRGQPVKDRLPGPQFWVRVPVPPRQSHPGVLQGPPVFHLQGLLQQLGLLYRLSGHHHRLPRVSPGLQPPVLGLEVGHVQPDPVGRRAGPKDVNLVKLLL